MKELFREGLPKESRLHCFNCNKRSTVHNDGFGWMVYCPNMREVGACDGSYCYSCYNLLLRKAKGDSQVWCCSPPYPVEILWVWHLLARQPHSKYGVTPSMERQLCMCMFQVVWCKLEVETRSLWTEYNVLKKIQHRVPLSNPPRPIHCFQILQRLFLFFFHANTHKDGSISCCACFVDVCLL